MANKKLNLSFKNTTRDTKLFMYVQKQEEKSDFIKKAIEFYIDYLERKEK